MKNRILLSLLSAAVLSSADPVSGCTNLLITRGASADGSTSIAYTADSHALYGELYHFPAGIHVPGHPVRIFEWDTGDYLSEIPQVARTYEVVGNMNERQLAIGETTWGGRPELVDPKGGIDYGSLMYLALQRAATAREAIKVMTDLVAEHGYRSSGESISIADPNEVWILEIIGKGKESKGAVWVAVRIPDGAISAHANHSRIHQFPLNDPANCLYAKDVISFAREKKYFAGKDEEFSFSAAYAPPDYGALRFCESRVWNLFRRAAPSLNLPTDLIDGDPSAKPLPLYVRPDRKLAVRDVMDLMRDHFEGTKYDLSKGLGAGPYSLPYRWRPMTWEVDGKQYLHERSISTQQTGFSFVTQARANLPDPIGGIIWFGVDDAYTSVWVPMYCGIRRSPKSYAVGTGSFTEFSWDSAFWVFNFVSNWTYTRYSDMIQDVTLVQRELEGEFFSRQPDIEKQALALHQQSPEAARAFLTEYSCDQADRTVARWRKLGEQLLMKYLDGNVRDAHGKATHPKHPEAWLRRIVEEDAKNGGILEMKKLPGEPEPQH